ncbi:hypothetical protein ACFRCG_17925 [Embleya sp. NPDC056575]|uniref:hypothetical protein n=1 Tax=unclassified Embleya TaxID=2699296 RepID=UPI0036BF7B05
MTTPSRKTGEGSGSGGSSSSTSSSTSMPSSTPPAPVTPRVAASTHLATYAAAPNSYTIYWEDRDSYHTKAIRVPIGGVELILNLHFGGEDDVWFGFGSAYVRDQTGNECNINALTTAAQRQTIRDQIEGDFNTRCLHAYSHRLDGTPPDWRQR